MKTVRYSKAALRMLRRISANESERIKRKIDEYADDPASQANNVIALKGQPGIRLRVGNWRVVMQDEQVLEIIEIGSRGSIY
jgi:mRNA interferase RelE/StbE